MAGGCTWPSATAIGHSTNRGRMRPIHRTAAGHGSCPCSKSSSAAAWRGPPALPFNTHTMTTTPPASDVQASEARNTKSVHKRGKPVYGPIGRAALSSRIHREVSNDDRDDTGASRAEGILRGAGLYSAPGPADPG